VITTRETEIARECLRNGNKQKALLALRRKKYQESLLSKTDQQLAQLQALTSDVEFALVQKDVLFGLQQGTAVLKEIHKEMGGLDKVEMILEESAEAHAYQKVGNLRSGDELGRAMLTRRNRRSMRCWEARCRMRTRMKWRMSLKLWQGRHSVYQPCRTHPRAYRSLYRMLHSAILRERRRERRRELGKEKGSKLLWREETARAAWDGVVFAAFSEGVVIPMGHVIGDGICI